MSNAVPERTWGEWASSLVPDVFKSKPGPEEATVATTSSDGVAVGARRRRPKTYRKKGGKKTRRSRSGKRSNRLS